MINNEKSLKIFRKFLTILIEKILDWFSNAKIGEKIVEDLYEKFLAAIEAGTFDFIGSENNGNVS
jgi:hypothetical protein